jgi:putative transcriptional regulator
MPCQMRATEPINGIRRKASKISMIEASIFVSLRGYLTARTLRRTTKLTATMRIGSSALAWSIAHSWSSSIRCVDARSESYQQDWQKGGKSMNSRSTSAPASEGRVDRARIDATSEAEIASKAAADRKELGIDFDSLNFYSVLPLPAPDVRGIRKHLGLTQSEFASRFGLKLRTIQQWEQGRTIPDRPARVLLKTIEYDPGAVTAAIGSVLLLHGDQRSISSITITLVDRWLRKEPQLTEPLPVEKRVPTGIHIGTEPNGGRGFAA